MSDLVSIIMAVYNAEKYVAEAIGSVLDQTYQHWELLVVNDGSTDNTLKIIESFDDERIRVFNQENQGVSSARNCGLAAMKGVFFCFLDGDDFYPPKSIQSRIEKFRSKPSLAFVDGWVERRNESCDEMFSVWQPTFGGDPLSDLVRLTGKSFAGLTWMIRTNHGVKYQMNTDITHGEDLLFVIDLSLNKSQYDYVEETILIYRQHSHSAMRNLKKLELGYRKIGIELDKRINVSRKDLKAYKYRTKRIMFLSYLRAKRPFNALKSLL